MSILEVVLLLHSWLRWPVLLLGTTVVARMWRVWRNEGVPPSRALHLGFIVALDTQVSLGLVMYLALSPLPSAAFENMAVAMGDPVLRFYSVEHIFGMVVALIAAHVAFASSRPGRIAEGDARDPGRSTFLAQCVWLLVTLASIPWPGFPYGRELFRLFS